MVSYITPHFLQCSRPRESTGYCGAEFSHMSDNAPHAMNSKVDATSKQTFEFYECRRVPIVREVNFLSKSP